MQSTRFPFEDFDEPQTPQENADSTQFVGTPIPVSAPVANENATIKPEEPKKVTVEELEAAKKTAFTEGKIAGAAEGRAAAIAEAEAQKEALNNKISILLESLNVQLATLFGSIEQYCPAHFTPLIHQLSLGIAKKVIGESLKEGISDQVDSYIDRSLQLLFDQPQLTVYLHPEMEAPLMDRVQELAVKNNFRGEVVIKPDSSLTESDCRLDWQDGFSEISQEEILNAIQKILEAN